MATDLDAFSALPLTRAHLETLPAGLQSFPEAKINTDVFTPVRARFPDLVRDSRLPPRLAAILEQAAAGHWVLEVEGCALFSALRELRFASDAAFADFGYDASASLFRGVLYRMLFAIISPTLAAMGAPKRWGAFHQGSTLTAAPAHKEGGRILVRLTLVGPPKLFAPAMIAYNAKAIQAAADAANAKASRAEVEETSERQAVFAVSWDA